MSKALARRKGSRSKKAVAEFSGSAVCLYEAVGLYFPE